MNAYECLRNMSKVKEVDLESGATLFPGLNPEENRLKWAFIDKVSGILSSQILLTAIIFTITVLCTLIHDFLRGNSTLLIFFIFLSFILLWPLHLYQDKHPQNKIFLGLFTASISFTVGFNFGNTEGVIVLQAFILTAAVICSLIAYTFWASKKGKDYSNVTALSFTCLFVLILTVLMQMFIPLWPTSHAIYGGIGVVMVTGYIIYDTENMIECFA